MYRIINAVFGTSLGRIIFYGTVFVGGLVAAWLLAGEAGVDDRTAVLFLVLGAVLGLCLDGVLTVEVLLRAWSRDRRDATEACAANIGLRARNRQLEDTVRTAHTRLVQSGWSPEQAAEGLGITLDEVHQ